jgi:hypothetical protein
MYFHDGFKYRICHPIAFFGKNIKVSDYVVFEIDR